MVERVIADAKLLIFASRMAGMERKAAIGFLLTIAR